MARHIVLLRGINIGSRNRIAMPELREALEDAGLRRRADVRPERQRRPLERQGREPRSRASASGRSRRASGSTSTSSTRTRAQLAKVVEREPAREGREGSEALPGELLSAAVRRAVRRKLEDAAAEQERVVFAGRRSTRGIPRDRAVALWTLLAGRGLGVTATARNWTTVTKLLELADSLVLGERRLARRLVRGLRLAQEDGGDDAGAECEQRADREGEVVAAVERDECALAVRAQAVRSARPRGSRAPRGRARRPS